MSASDGIASAPRTRGWFAAAALGGLLQRVGPAHAGMVLPRAVRRRHRPGRPRARGDGSRRSTEAPTGTPSAPRTRGWFEGWGSSGYYPRVGPAHAGMVPGRAGRAHAGRGRPRARGDGSGSRSGTRPTSASAPRTRGWFSAGDGAAAGADVGPAHAGMVPACPCGRRTRGRRPRARGDGSFGVEFGGVMSLSAPRTRGWFLPSHPPTCRSAVGPAHAGMVPGGPRRPGPARRRPRARGDGSGGDGSAFVRVTATVAGSAPRTRGWFAVHTLADGETLVGPAHAGMVRAGRAAAWSSPRRPRARGDGSASPPSRRASSSSAPRTRGWFLRGRVPQ